MNRPGLLSFLCLLSTCLVASLAVVAQEAPKTTPPKPPAQAPSVAPSASAPAATQPDNSARVVVRFGKHQLTAAEFEKMVNSLPAQYQALARGEAKRRIAAEYAKMLALADEARRRNLDQREPTRTKIEFNVNNMLAAAAYQEIQSQTSVSEAEIQAYYDAHKMEFERVHARHILIRLQPITEEKTKKPGLTDEQAKAKAEDIRKQILAGVDFAKLAKENSDDSSTAEKGGDLGYFRRGSMVPEFENAAFALKPNEVSEPVKSPFGYHVIRVEDHSATPLTEVQTEISSKVKAEKVEQEVVALMGGNPVFDEEYFKPATPAVQPPQPSPQPQP
jgi:parvulin-like peptidyl-prolyl isomerase